MEAELAAWVAAYGLWGLAAASFLAATLLPFSSEVALVVALAAGLPPWAVFGAASAGNALGASVNYGLGWLFAERTQERLATSRAGRRALAWGERYGAWSLWGSWLPVVGDPICLVAGLLRLPVHLFVTVGIGTRVARYLVVMGVFFGAFAGIMH